MVQPGVQRGFKDDNYPGFNNITDVPGANYKLASCLFVLLCWLRSWLISWFSLARSNEESNVCVRSASVQNPLGDLELYDGNLPERP